MTDVGELLRRYIEQNEEGREVDPADVLSRVEGADRAQLEALIDAYLQAAPRRPWDAGAHERSGAREVAESLTRALAGQSGLWPALLPRLRNRAQITRSDLVAQLAERLGAQSGREKVATYYNKMEHGHLPAAGVSDTVLEALGKIVGQSKETLRSAGSAVAPATDPAGQHGAAEATAFARVANGERRHEADTPGIAGTSEQPDDQPDEIDRLFRGG